MKKIKFKKVTKKEKKRLLQFALMLGMGLAIITIVAFIIVGGSKVEDVQPKKQVTENSEAPYTTTMRIALVDADNDIYRNSVSIYNQAGDFYNSYSTDAAEVGEIVTLESGEVNGISTAGIIIGDENGNMSNPYQGKLEIWFLQDGIVVVNELDIEEYLKHVVASEMPESFGLEALKAQAVCARTYAYKHSNKYAYPEVNANMDDTVSFQVYNKNVGSTTIISAVEGTTGIIIVNKDTGKPIDALYFSTSCGITQDGKIMGEDLDNTVLAGVYVGVKDEDMADYDIYSAFNIEEYIKDRDKNALETDAKYYRWNTTMDKNGCRDALVSKLIDISEKEGAIQCDEEFYEILMSNNKSVGSLKSIGISERATTGAVTKLTCSFDEGTIDVIGQLNVREVLGASTRNIDLNDGSEISADMLPSAIIAIEDKGDYYVIYGGGYGHGCGMSQNGARMLASQGLGYEEILRYFYHNSSIVSY
ncbi:MAG: SpoIID/LytB domain-containing protein [Lachnospiraceae bacterium]|nr:SpoIID/LytB domain-containing protein [Lachnospiraceae bacterium]